MTANGQLKTNLALIAMTLSSNDHFAFNLTGCSKAFFKKRQTNLKRYGKDNEMSIQSRQDFLKKGAVFAGSASALLITGCASPLRGSSPLAPVPKAQSNRIKFSAKASSTGGVRPDSWVLNDATGEMEWQPSGNSSIYGTLQGSASVDYSDVNFSADFFQKGTLNQTVQVTTDQGDSAAVMMPIADGTVGQTQTANYSDGSSMVYSPVDSENCTGTFTAPDGSTYTTSMQMTSSSLTFSWTGPSSGSFSVDLNSDGTIAPDSIHPMSTCGTLGRVSATFAVAGLFLTVISLGTMALVYGVISAGIAVYAAVKCA